MTDPLTPPTELVAQWTEKAEYWEGAYEKDIATQAAQWGADQELEACCEWLEWWNDFTAACQLRTARRPKPLSLKEEALKALDAVDSFGNEGDRDTIRRALEQLND